MRDPKLRAELRQARDELLAQLADPGHQYPSVGKRERRASVMHVDPALLTALELAQSRRDNAFLSGDLAPLAVAQDQLIAALGSHPSARSPLPGGRR